MHGGFVGIVGVFFNFVCFFYLIFVCMVVWVCVKTRSPATSSENVPSMQEIQTLHFTGVHLGPSGSKMMRNVLAQNRSLIDIKLVPRSQKLFNVTICKIESKQHEHAQTTTFVYNSSNVPEISRSSALKTEVKLKVKMNETIAIYSNKSQDCCFLSLLFFLMPSL